MKKYYILLAIIVAVIIIKNYVIAEDKNTVITRPDYNSESEYLELNAEVEGDNIPINLEVNPIRLTANEAYEIFQRVGKSLAEKIPSEIEFGTIELIDESDGVDIFWLSSDEKIITNSGIINPYELNFGESKNINLMAVLSIGEYRYEREFEIKVKCVYPTSEEQKQLWLETRIGKYIEENSEAQNINLPEKIDGISVEFAKKNGNGAELIIIIIIALTGIFAAKKMEVSQQLKNKKRQMEIDYCEIVSKLVMLMGAGLTIKNAWSKTVTDYEENKSKTGIRYAYEEMAVTVNELAAGIPERLVYENFGKRCKLSRYVKLGSLLQQNFIKGSKQLLNLLETESDAAFEERKMLAQKQGEEAGTKLLIPMILELLSVMVIVMFPALMGF